MAETGTETSDWLIGCSISRRIAVGNCYHLADMSAHDSPISPAHDHLSFWLWICVSVTASSAPPPRAQPSKYAISHHTRVGIIRLIRTHFRCRLLTRRFPGIAENTVSGYLPAIIRYLRRIKDRKISMMPLKNIYNGIM